MATIGLDLSLFEPPKWCLSPGGDVGLRISYLWGLVANCRAIGEDNLYVGVLFVSPMEHINEESIDLPLSLTRSAFIQVVNLSSLSSGLHFSRCVRPLHPGSPGFVNKEPSVTRGPADPQQTGSS